MVLMTGRERPTRRRKRKEMKRRAAEAIERLRYRKRGQWWGLSWMTIVHVHTPRPLGSPVYMQTERS
jgi:hypothetical protein